MLRILPLIAAGALAAVACTGSSLTRNPSRAASPVSPPPAATPAPPSPSGLYRLDTFAPVTEATLGRRIPAAESGTVLIDRASARMGTCDLDMPRDTLRLSVVMMEIRTWTYGATYEWQFIPETSAAPIPPDPPTRRIAAREVGGKWGAYIDTGAGWMPLPDARVQFGVFEVVVDVPRATASGLPEAPVQSSPPRATGGAATNFWWRAVVHGRSLHGDRFEVGGAYPPGGNWYVVC